MKDIAKLFAGILAMITLIGFGIAIVCEGLSVIGASMYSTKIRFPLSNVGSYDVDEEGSIYCYTGAYHRMQIFDSDGSLLKGWFVKAGRGGQIQIKDNQIHFASIDDKYFIFDMFGNVVTQSKDNDAYNRLYKIARKEDRRDGSDNTYKLKNTLVNTRIFKFSPSGERSLVLTDPLYLWFFRLLLPCSLFCLPFGIWIGIASIRKKSDD